MDYFLFLLIIIFVTINIIQVWLIFTLKILVRDGLIIGALEIFELPLAVYLLLKGQWTVVAYFSTKSKMK